ncbi:unnamed protein product [Blepharisma stoltei]|uniref:Uncharacterized protein n=1 Tax=Blepharisma stoltei TaxID=1481888 RepID=A0AAU9JNW6_9CILI|nr:unnamed protein product [Blepharisma stoltei]
MDPEEIRRKRREKVLARAGATVERTPEPDATPKEEQTTKEKFIEMKKKDSRNKMKIKIKNLITCILAVIFGISLAFGYEVRAMSYFLLLIIGFKFIDFVSTDISISNRSVHIVEKCANVYQVIDDIFKSIALFVFTLTMTLTLSLSIVQKIK